MTHFLPENKTTVHETSISIVTTKAISNRESVLSVFILARTVITAHEMADNKLYTTHISPSVAQL